MPLQRRVPKFGFKNFNRVEYKPVNLDVLQSIADEKKITNITLDILKESGVLSGKDLCKILSRGELKAAFNCRSTCIFRKGKTTN